MRNFYAGFLDFCYLYTMAILIDILYTYANDKMINFSHTMNLQFVIYSNNIYIDSYRIISMATFIFKKKKKENRQYISYKRY